MDRDHITEITNKTTIMRKILTTDNTRPKRKKEKSTYQLNKNTQKMKKMSQVMKEKD
jgi:hypothetical protein